MTSSTFAGTLLTITLPVHSTRLFLAAAAAPPFLACVEPVLPGAPAVVLPTAAPLLFAAASAPASADPAAVAAAAAAAESAAGFISASTPTSLPGTPFVSSSCVSAFTARAARSSRDSAMFHSSSVRPRLSPPPASPGAMPAAPVGRTPPRILRFRRSWAECSKPTSKTNSPCDSSSRAASSSDRRASGSSSSPSPAALPSPPPPPSTPPASAPSSIVRIDMCFAFPPLPSPSSSPKPSWSRSASSSASVVVAVVADAVVATPAVGLAVRCWAVVAPGAVDFAAPLPLALPAAADAVADGYRSACCFSTYSAKSLSAYK